MMGGGFRISDFGFRISDGPSKIIRNPQSAIRNPNGFIQYWITKGLSTAALLMIWMGWVGSVGGAYAQPSVGSRGQDVVSAEATVDSSVVTLGTPITYTLVVRHPEGVQIEIPGVEDSLSARGFELKGRRRLEGHRTEEGLIEGGVQFTLVAWKTGEYRIPPAQVRFVTVAGDTGSVYTDGWIVTVQSVTIDGVEPKDAQDILDIKGPLTISGRFPAWLAFLIGGAILAVGGSLYLRWRHKRRDVVEVESARPKPVDELSELEKIRALRLIDQGRYKEHYILLSEALRRYIERRYGIKAMEQTTYELCWDLRRDRVAEEEAVQQIEAFLQECDLVKFARYVPPFEVMRSSVDRAKDIVRAGGVLVTGLEERALSKTT